MTLNVRYICLCGHFYYSSTALNYSARSFRIQGPFWLSISRWPCTTWLGLLCEIRAQTYIYLLAPFEEVLMGRELGWFQDKKFPQQFIVSAGNRGMWVCTVCMQLGPVILQQKKPLVWKMKIESEGQAMALHVWQKQPFYLCRKSPRRGEESKTNLMSRGTVRAGKENER